ncbi:MAG: calcium/sodium antiporter [Deltaproteobacteria bacterium]|nr:calcium/sodium antiporter [Deltaproteobacteria bacterium]
MSLHPGLVFLGGLVVIIVGAEVLLRGAARLAAMLGIKPILIGMTVVAVGTSAPELAVGIAAVLEGTGSLAVANIAGTNIANILLILGLSAAIRPLPLQLQSLRLDVPVMIVSSVALLAMAWNGVLTRAEGAVLVLAGLAYTVALVRLSRRESARMHREFAEEFSAKALEAGRGAGWGLWNATVLVLGVGLTVLGAELLVPAAVELAKIFGASDVVVGLTIVAIGTSAPELATTLVATVRDERDVAVGNLIGSSIMNILVVLGLICIAAPDGVDVSRDVLWFDLPMGAAVAVACYPVFRRDRLVSRREGIAFVAVYLLYLTAVVWLRV